MQTGQVVSVRLYGGQTALRRVVADKGDIIVICSEEEYRQAQAEGRSPSGLGFPRQDIVDPDQAKKKGPVSDRYGNLGEQAGD